MKYIKKKLNRKGMSAIEMVIAFMMIAMMIAFLVDVVIILGQYSVISQVNTDIARITSIQGGALSTSPKGWPGGNDNYLTLAKLENQVADKFNSVGIPAEDWSVAFVSVGSENGSFGSIGQSPAEIDYQDNYSVIVTVKQRWSTVSSFVPGLISHNFTSKRPATSEWKYNYDNWIGE